MRILSFALASLIAAPALAAPDYPAVAKRGVEDYVLPGYETLAQEAAALEAVSAECVPEKTIAAYHSAFDAWMGVSHLAFGPAEAQGRALAIAFWPDAKGFTPKTLRRLITAEDPAVNDEAHFAEISIAARGLLALDYLLSDPEISQLGTPEYRCRLEVAIARDLHRTALIILDAWKEGYAELMETAGAEDNRVYLAESEPTQALYKALVTGMQWTLEQRLDRPLGTFERPMPTRAEAWRSGRSLRNIQLSLAALNALYEVAFKPEVSALTNEPIEAAFDFAMAKAKDAPGPLDEAVTNPGERFRIEALRSAVYVLLEHLEATLGEQLGVAAGFNAGDGD